MLIGSLLVKGGWALFFLCFFFIGYLLFYWPNDFQSSVMVIFAKIKKLFENFISYLENLIWKLFENVISYLKIW